LILRSSEKMKRFIKMVVDQQEYFAQPIKINTH